MSFLFRGNKPISVRQFTITIAVALFLVALLLLAASGRLHWLVAAGAAILPFLRRLPLLLRFIPFASLAKTWWQRRQAANRVQPGQASSVSTRFLHMTLDHDSGAMDGEILTGPATGRRLSQLTLVELMSLRDLCLADPDSLQVLDTWLDRHHETWREQAQSRAQASAGHMGMTEREALEILGLDAAASSDEIIDAHRRLMQKVHPDHGGSTYLAAKLNEAKDLLLG